MHYSNFATFLTLLAGTTLAVPLEPRYSTRVLIFEGATPEATYTLYPPHGVTFDICRSPLQKKKWHLQVVLLIRPKTIPKSRSRTSRSMVPESATYMVSTAVPHPLVMVRLLMWDHRRCKLAGIALLEG